MLGLIEMIPPSESPGETQVSQLSVQLQRDVGAVPDGHRLIQPELVCLVGDRHSPVEPLERSRFQPIEVRIQRKRAVVCNKARQDA